MPTPAGRNGLGPPSALPGLPCARVAWAVSDMRTVRMPLPWESRCCERAPDPTGLAADCRRHCSRLTSLFVRRSPCRIGVYGGAGESSWSLRCICDLCVRPFCQVFGCCRKENHKPWSARWHCQKRFAFMFTPKLMCCQLLAASLMCKRDGLNHSILHANRVGVSETCTR